MAQGPVGSDVESAPFIIMPAKVAANGVGDDEEEGAAPGLTNMKV